MPWAPTTMRAELEQGEGPPGVADALLPEERRARASRAGSSTAMAAMTGVRATASGQGHGEVEGPLRRARRRGPRRSGKRLDHRDEPGGQRGPVVVLQRVAAAALAHPPRALAVGGHAPGSRRRAPRRPPAAPRRRSRRRATMRVSSPVGRGGDDRPRGAEVVEGLVGQRAREQRVVLVRQQADVGAGEPRRAPRAWAPSRRRSTLARPRRSRVLDQRRLAVAAAHEHHAHVRARRAGARRRRARSRASCRCRGRRRTSPRRRRRARARRARCVVLDLQVDAVGDEGDPRRRDALGDDAVADALGEGHDAVGARGSSRPPAAARRR